MIEERWRVCVCVCGLMYVDASRRYHIHQVRPSVRHQITEMANSEKTIGRMSKTPGTIHSSSHPKIAASFGTCTHRSVVTDWVHRFWPTFNLRRTSFIHFSFDLRRTENHHPVEETHAQTMYNVHIWGARKKGHQKKYKFQFITQSDWGTLNDHRAPSMLTLKP